MNISRVFFSSLQPMLNFATTVVCEHSSLRTNRSIRTNRKCVFRDHMSKTNRLFTTIDTLFLHNECKYVEQKFKSTLTPL